MGFKVVDRLCLAVGAEGIDQIAARYGCGRNRDWFSREMPNDKDENDRYDRGTDPERAAMCRFDSGLNCHRR
jgi:hypothetical protein